MNIVANDFSAGGAKVTRDSGGEETSLLLFLQKEVSLFLFFLRLHVFFSCKKSLYFLFVLFLGFTSFCKKTFGGDNVKEVGNFVEF